MTNALTIREPMRLTAENVERVFAECLATPESTKRTNAHGVVLRVEFDTNRIGVHSADILDLLSQLPRSFFAGEGDGWTFLNMCIDDTGRQWTDFHQTADKLVCLGLAMGVLEFTIKQRELWQCFPGKMPYITIR